MNNNEEVKNNISETMDSMKGARRRFINERDSSSKSRTICHH